MDARGKQVKFRYIDITLSLNQRLNDANCTSQKCYYHIKMKTYILTFVRVVTFPGGEALDVLLSPSTSK